MKKLTNEELKLMRKILTLRQDKLKKLLKNYLDKHYDNVVYTSSYIYAEGGSPEGLGADDRAGIFSILYIILNTNLRPSIIFTTDEEAGGIGAKKLVSQIHKPISPIKFMIELDRRGSKDCVFYDGDNRDFVKYIEEFGFDEAYGSFSDISIISPQWKILGVNLSVGYYEEHSQQEHLKVGEMFKTIDKVKRILSSKRFPTFEYKETAYDYYRSVFPDDVEVCDNCGAMVYSYETIPAYIQDESGLLEEYYFCGKCAEKLIDWCPRCGSPYIAFDEYSACPVCKEY